MGLFSNGDSGTRHSKANVKAGQRRMIAQDMRARGQNPVTVSDLAQRNGIGNRQGRPFLSTLLGRR